MGRDKEAAALPPQTVGGDSGEEGDHVDFTNMSEEELVNLWEEIIDYDKEAARELFWEALMRDAVGSSTEHKQQKAATTAEEDGDGGDHPHTRFIQQPSTSSNTTRPAPPPPPTPDSRTVVLCLCAPAAPPLANADRRKRPRAAPPETVPTRKKRAQLPGVASYRHAASDRDRATTASASDRDRAQSDATTASGVDLLRRIS
ncbi:hypothetical protein GUJ93_ZPchr0001g32526 [Zizania palustris]|uniref:Uncharacterized protein n=1 Tax=Zizania palustris TaxID=103762 RepID=A0A8J5RBS5_ZIZPA|nr:hypothetical protein GUJ93_ZPchr0001g32526 [Zizania palustris]